MVHSQEYLGVPTTSRGCQWGVLLDKQLKKASSMLTYLDMTSKAWPEWIKLQLVKTFVLSQLQYCSASTAYWYMSNKKQKLGQEITTKMEKLDDQIYRYIFHVQYVIGKPVMQYMLLLESVTSLVENQVHYVSTQFSVLDPTNPLVVFHSKRSMFSDTTFGSNMFKLFKTTPVFEAFMQEMSALVPKQRLLFKSWMKRRLKVRIWKQVGVMQKYILDRSRPKELACDGVLFIQDDEVRSVALKWRRNQLYTKRKCFVCKNVFNRAHLVKCDYWSKVPLELKLFVHYDQWLVDQQELTACNDKNYWEYKGHYTILDCMLNSQDYKAFGLWINWMEDMFVKNTGQ
jgi:hypothetical protein